MRTSCHLPAQADGDNHDSSQPLDETPVVLDQLYQIVQDDALIGELAELSDSAEDAARFRDSCVGYLNTVRGIEFQNVVLSGLMEQLLPHASIAERRYRASFLGRWIPESIAGVPRSAAVAAVDTPADPAACAALKLDISDRLNKRFFLRRQRVESAAVLIPVVSSLRMRRWEARAHHDAEPSPLRADHSISATSRVQPSHVTNRSADGLRRRTPPSSQQPLRIYSDAEVRAALRECSR